MARKKGLTFYEKEKKISKSLIREILITILYCLIAVFLAFVIVWSIGMKISMIGISMEPAIGNGQEVLVNKFIYRIASPKRGDVVVFLPNGNQNSHYYLKRVVGLPGERIQILDGYVYINGELLQENEKFDKIAEAGLAENEIILESDEYFVLGDYRNNSEDSRSGNIGPVKKDTIVGKVWFRLRQENSVFGPMN